MAPGRGRCSGICIPVVPGALGHACVAVLIGGTPRPDWESMGRLLSSSSLGHPCLGVASEKGGLASGARS